MEVGRLINYSPERYLESMMALRTAYGRDQRDRDPAYYQYFVAKVPDSALCEPGTDLRVLGIGSGSGDVDSAILKKLLQRHNSVYNRVVEPSGEMIERYKTRVREDTSLGAVNFDWRQQTAEEYVQTKDDTKFHLIHAVHVLYHVEDLDATLRNMWEQLADGGYMFITIKSDACYAFEGKDAGGKLYYKLWEKFGKGDRLKTSLRTSVDVEQWLDARGISYDVTSEDVAALNIDISECFNEKSEAGMKILDFLTQTPHVSNMPEIRAMTLEHMQCNSSMVNGKRLYKVESEDIVAFKKCE
ncbi:histamine N-methyltransferase-like isoform X1 [Branchiostoma floridae]|uniref:Histamine N-methyltransferase-like isoform X1 n=1 Tax=Branchiostoma floridae TaxID=7739 RepID=A0A9J7N583_BRAFL|nr:histamine N-methyltransferase-like isoform X1 [Branchiostoma floridae]